MVYYFLMRTMQVPIDFIDWKQTSEIVETYVRTSILVYS